MGKSNRITGLIKRGNVWHIDKKIQGCRFQESTGTSDLYEAEKYLIRRMEEIREASVYGIRPTRIFRQAATKYLNEAIKRTLDDNAAHLKQLDEFIGDFPIDRVNMLTLQGFIETRKQQGIKTKSINNALEVVRHILNLAANEWFDEHGLTWLQRASKIKLMPVLDSRKPSILSWEDQAKLLDVLPPHLAKMALFKVNVGCREHEVCALKWEWETKIPSLGTSVFVVPGSEVKNGEKHLLVLNRIAKSVIDDMRGQHKEYVFTFRGHPINKMNNNGWKHARAKVGLSNLRVHDLRHTCGSRLRAADVSLEDRQTILGHKSRHITTHYSAPNIKNLLDAMNKLCDETLVVID